MRLACFSAVRKDHPGSRVLIERREEAGPVAPTVLLYVQKIYYGGSRSSSLRGSLSLPLLAREFAERYSIVLRDGHGPEPNQKQSKGGDDLPEISTTHRCCDALGSGVDHCGFATRNSVCLRYPSRTETPSAKPVIR